jgi:hypothetical protein
VTVHGVRTSQVPRGGEMVPPHLDQHLPRSMSVLSNEYMRLSITPLDASLELFWPKPTIPFRAGGFHTIVGMFSGDGVGNVL